MSYSFRLTNARRKVMTPERAMAARNEGKPGIYLENKFSSLELSDKEGTR